MIAPLLDGALRFDTFVVGASNRLAAAAARAVAEAPGTAYNPLFIYGGSGLGKTHLVAAIAWQARQVRPGLRVEVTTGEELAEQLRAAVAAGHPEGLAERLRHVDLLVLDDVQFLTGQRETQNELLRLFNRMQAGGRQLVMTSDRAPAEIRDVDERLLSRLAGGLVVDVGAPDYEMRLAILRAAGAGRAPGFAPGVLEAVARLPFGNVRELKGALNRLTAYQQLDGTAVQPQDVRAVLGERSLTPAREVAVLPGAGTEAGVDFEGFLADVTRALEDRVAPWRTTLGEAAAEWRAAGYAVDVLERARALPAPPDVEGLLDTFRRAVEHLRALEARATALDPRLAGHRVWRDPAAVAEAEAFLAAQEVARAEAAALPRPSPALTWESLALTGPNELVRKALQSVRSAPGRGFNPLVVVGGPGAGKSHVLHALGNALAADAAAAGRPARVACLDAGAFTDGFVAALQDGSVERWRAAWRGADALLLDDVHLLADKERTQEELFHLFNHLHARGAQIVLTADRPVAAIAGLADRLRSRFGGGLVVEVRRAPGGSPTITPGAVRGVVRGPDDFFRDREKMVWEWPDLADRLIEELR
jgi:chromosomal replication initiation ATPase DnaA